MQDINILTKSYEELEAEYRTVRKSLETETEIIDQQDKISTKVELLRGQASALLLRAYKFSYNVINFLGGGLLSLIRDVEGNIKYVEKKVGENNQKIILLVNEDKKLDNELKKALDEIHLLKSRVTYLESRPPGNPPSGSRSRR